MKNIIVTGGCGFIGRNLCESLLADGDCVYALDNFYTGSRENMKELLKKYKKMLKFFG